MLVTDVKRVLKNGKVMTGYYLDGYLKENLDTIPEFLKKDWDCVGIISGHGKVRIGKSTMAMQIGYYIAWLLAGGKMKTHFEGKKIIIDERISPKNPVRFNLKENVVFSAEDLVKTASRLFRKYGKNQIIVYDEGRQGLDSARAMESINKVMVDFFQECGFYNHVILIVLPDFFKLHVDYAVSRSFFLIDCFHTAKYQKGFFNFYNEKQKEYLYFFGKRRLGVSARYTATNESFWGRFYKWLPFPKEDYEKAKMEALEKKAVGRQQKNWKLQRDFLIYYSVREKEATIEDMRRKMKKFVGIDLSVRTFEDAIANASNYKQLHADANSPTG